MAENTPSTTQVEIDWKKVGGTILRETGNFARTVVGTVCGLALYGWLTKPAEESTPQS